MSSTSRGLAPREGLEYLVNEDGPYRPAGSATSWAAGRQVWGPPFPEHRHHAEWIFSSSGYHVLGGSHLVTWGLDTTLISDLSHCAVEWWSLGGDDPPLASPTSLPGVSLDLSSGWPRPCQARLPGKGGFSLVTPCFLGKSWSS